MKTKGKSSVRCLVRHSAMLWQNKHIRLLPNILSPCFAVTFYHKDCCHSPLSADSKTVRLLSWCFSPTWDMNAANKCALALHVKIYSAKNKRGFPVRKEVRTEELSRWTKHTSRENNASWWQHSLKRKSKEINLFFFFCNVLSDDIVMKKSGTRATIKSLSVCHRNLFP